MGDFLANLRTKLSEFKIDQSAVSLALGAIVVVVIGVLVFNYFSKLNRPINPIPINTPETSSLKSNNSNIPAKHTVEAGETLGTIAEKYYGTSELWTKLCEANSDILKKNCDLLEPGVELTILPKDVAANSASPLPLPSPKAVSATLSPTIMPSTGIASAASQVDTYTIVRGDTLCGILTRFSGSCTNVENIARCNNIANPNLIHADNILKLRCE